MPAAIDNIGIAKRVMKQTAVLWVAEAPDDFGKPTYATPVAIDCRWTVKNVEFIGANNERELSRAVVVVDRDITLGSMLFLGAIADLTDENNPIENDGAWEVRQFGSTPDLKAKKFYRKVLL